MMKQYLLISFLFLATFTNAQKLFTNSKDFNIFHGYTKWGIQLDGLLYFPAEIDPANNISFYSQYGIGYKLGPIYNLNFTNHFGLRVGALVGQVPAINTHFLLKKDDINASDDYQHKKWAIYSPMFNYSFPILFEYRNFSIDRYTLSFDGGIQIERTTGAVITETYKKYYQTTVSNSGNWDIDLVFKAGWYFQFKPIMLQTSIVYKYRLIDQYVGNYSFNNLNNSADVSGKYIQKGNYIGLSFDFYFHHRDREVKMSCHAHTQSTLVRKRKKRAQRIKEKERKRQEKIRNQKIKKIRKKTKKKWIFW